MLESNWMIYGANGYTGELIAREAVKHGMKPVLAGRSSSVIGALGAELGLPTRVFSLEDRDGISRQLEGMAVVLHCAGPFTVTARPMLEACLAVKVHYLDITGEIGVFETLYTQDRSARAAGITAISGVGFDVVPTDTVAALLAREMPDATTLRLGIRALDGISKGTARTWLEIAAGGGFERRDGKLEPASIGTRSRMIPFDDEPGFAVNMPSAELSSAYRTTRIPNIEMYFSATPESARSLQLSSVLGPLLRVNIIRWGLQALIGRIVKGPDEAARTSGRTVIWGETENPSGRKLALRLRAPEAYRFTVLASLEAVKRVLEGQAPHGALTPTQAFGAEFATTIPGVNLEQL
jgi:short subunit dehydrogenase-like uncharacterized protein